MKIQREYANTLSAEEFYSVVPLSLFSDNSEQVPDYGMTFVELALKRQKYMRSNSSAQYLDSRFILAMSSIFER